MTNLISQRFLPSGEALGLGFGQSLTVMENYGTANKEP